MLQAQHLVNNDISSNVTEYTYFYQEKALALLKQQAECGLRPKAGSKARPKQALKLKNTTGCASGRYRYQVTRP